MAKTLLIFFLAVFIIPPSAAGFDISVSPESVKQGDAFLIKIRSNDTVPAGTIEQKDLYFQKTSAGHYAALAFVGIEQSPGTYEITINLDGVSKTATLKVSPLQAQKISLRLDEEKVSLSPENERRAEAERKKLLSLLRRYSLRLWNGKFAPPVDTEVSTGFGTMRIINGHKKSIHKGIDYRGRENYPVKSINAGKVVLTGDRFFGGNTVMIDHGEGIFSVYMHLNTILVTEGQYVNKSEIIGTVGSTGRATGPHLHLTVKWKGLTVNPLSLIKLNL